MSTLPNVSAAIYIGAYSAQMLIARMKPELNSFELVNQFTTLTHMMQDCSEDGIVSETGMQRLFHVLREFHQTGLLEGVSVFYVAATSSLRSVTNRSLILLGCQREFGEFPRLLSGRDEARLNFIGAISDAMANMPVIAFYPGFNNICLAYGTASRIDAAFELDFGISDINERLEKLRRMMFRPFRVAALHRYVTKHLAGFSADYKKWRESIVIEPEFMAIGPVPMGCLALLTKQPVFGTVDSISAIPQTAASLTEMSRSLVLQPPEAPLRQPGIDREMAPVLAAGMMTLRCALELTGSYEFRVTPFGVCAGMLKSPSWLFTQTNV